MLLDGQKVLWINIFCIIIYFKSISVNGVLNMSFCSWRFGIFNVFELVKHNEYCTFGATQVKPREREPNIT